MPGLESPQRRKTTWWQAHPSPDAAHRRPKTARPETTAASIHPLSPRQQCEITCTGSATPLELLPLRPIPATETEEKRTGMSLVQECQDSPPAHSIEQNLARPRALPASRKRNHFRQKAAASRRTRSVNYSLPAPPAIMLERPSPENPRAQERFPSTPGRNSNEVPAHAGHLPAGRGGAAAHRAHHAECDAARLRLLRRIDCRLASLLAISFQPNLLRLAGSIPGSRRNLVLLFRPYFRQRTGRHRTRRNRPALASGLCSSVVATRKGIHLPQPRASILITIR
jgi:hypothetical protein